MPCAAWLGVQLGTSSLLNACTIAFLPVACPCPTSVDTKKETTRDLTRFVVKDCNLLLTLCRGFTSYLRDDYLEWKREGRLVNDGVNAKARFDGC